MQKFIEIHAENPKNHEIVPEIVNLDYIVMVIPGQYQNAGHAALVMGDASVKFIEESYEDIRSTIANIQGGFHIKQGTESVKVLD